MSRRCFHPFGVVALIALLVGCVPVKVREDAAGGWAAIPPGSTLTLNRPVQVPQDRARVFFLSGRVRPAGANTGPSCGLEVRTMSREGAQTIAPQTFRIVRVQNLWTEVARLQRPGPIRFQLAQATDGGGGTPLIQEGYHLWLSGADTNVMRLTCLGMLDDMWRARAITLEEIRAALGTVATLEIVGGT
ncbi:hypothetical protein [uncultured Lamprocystis sp.]|jgi:hypothetical protein|uniref:hypothetical protein n=1 Tax=uncultured Lamprocystis sp. TaxID=543132 RepID=UPI0025D50480|nr:hypothetical protein [uncultured Lamprocystis sp.]